MEPGSFDWLGKLLDGAVPLDEELQVARQAERLALCSIQQRILQACKDFH